jgi:hypothetical protein
MLPHGGPLRQRAQRPALESIARICPEKGERTRRRPSLPSVALFSTVVDSLHKTSIVQPLLHR